MQISTMTLAKIWIKLIDVDRLPNHFIPDAMNLNQTIGASDEAMPQDLYGINKPSEYYLIDDFHFNVRRVRVKYGSRE